MAAQLNSSSRAVCAYCGEHARPNAMYCMHCGQIIMTATASAPAHTSMHPTAQAAAQAASHAAQQPAPAAAPRQPLEGYLFPAPVAPAFAQVPAVSATQAQQLVAPPPVPKLASLDTRHIELEFANGERTKVDGTAVLGRRPEATARNSGAQAIPVPDETRSVSRAHAIIEVQGQTATISDAGSANGSSVERDGTILPLKSGRQISLRSGDRIWLGEQPIDVHISLASRGAHA